MNITFPSRWLTTRLIHPDQIQLTQIVHILKLIHSTDKQFFFIFYLYWFGVTKFFYKKNCRSDFYWHIWHKCRWGYTIMNCPSCVVIWCHHWCWHCLWTVQKIDHRNFILHKYTPSLWTWNIWSIWPVVFKW